MSDAHPVDVRGHPLESESYKGLSDKMSIDLAAQENYSQYYNQPLKKRILKANNSWRISFSETANISDVT